MANEKVFEIIEEHVEKLKCLERKETYPDGQTETFRPFFSSINVKKTKTYTIETTNGSTGGISKPGRPAYAGRLEMRMGDPEKGGSVEDRTFQLPHNLKKDAALRTLADETNEVFWECAKDYRNRVTDALGEEDTRDNYVYFSKEEPEVFEDKEKEIAPNMRELEHNLKAVSRELASDSRIHKADASFGLNIKDMYFVSTEGARIYTSILTYYVALEIEAADFRSLLIPHSTLFRGRDPSNIPTLDEMQDTAERLKTELFEILASPIQENGSFPTLFDAENHGVLWHEVIGHALEADKMQEDEEGDACNLFKDMMDKPIAPEFLSLFDDPTIAILFGHYLHDEDGVRGQRVELVGKGLLRDYLHSRQSAGYFKTKSNGHARSSDHRPPTARMSNLIVESSNSVSYDELIEDHLRLIRNQNLPYGLAFKKTNGGLTIATESFYNTFPTHIFRVYPDGRRQRVREVYAVGTPHETLKKIIKTSNRHAEINGKCGSRSGSVTSTIVAPDALLSSLEVSDIPASTYKKLKKQVVSRPRIR